MPLGFAGVADEVELILLAIGVLELSDRFRFVRLTSNNPLHIAILDLTPHELGLPKKTTVTPSTGTLKTPVASIERKDLVDLQLAVDRFGNPGARTNAGVAEAVAGLQRATALFKAEGNTDPFAVLKQRPRGP